MQVWNFFLAYFKNETEMISYKHDEMLGYGR